jgi:hypothetical protein
MTTRGSDDAIMPLFCPTEQAEFGKFANPSIRLMPATVHGVVFDISDETGDKSHPVSGIVRNQQASG